MTNGNTGLKYLEGAIREMDNRRKTQLGQLRTDEIGKHKHNTLI